MGTVDIEIFILLLVIYVTLPFLIPILFLLLSCPFLITFSISSSLKNLTLSLTGSNILITELKTVSLTLPAVNDVFHGTLKINLPEGVTSQVDKVTVTAELNK